MTKPNPRVISEHVWNCDCDPDDELRLTVMREGDGIAAGIDVVTYYEHDGHTQCVALSRDDAVEMARAILAGLEPTP